MSIVNESKTPLQSEKEPEIHFRRLKNAKRITLRVKTTDGSVCVTAPLWTSEKQAFDFVRKHQIWIDNQRIKLPPSSLESKTILVEGKEISIHSKPASDRPKTRGIPAALLKDSELHVWGDEIESTLSLKKFLKELAAQKLPQRLKIVEERTGFESSALKIRDASSRWGSCSQRKVVMLNWRLICTPQEVQEYVIVHELCHLQHFNHSQSFWNLVDSLCLDGKKGRLKCEKWLSLHTKRLQRLF